MAFAAESAKSGRQSKIDGTLELLDLPTMVAGVWKARALQARGDAPRTKGKKTEAVAKYREAPAMPGLGQGHIDRLNQAIADLRDRE